MSTAGLGAPATVACGASPPVPFGPCAPFACPASIVGQAAGYANVNASTVVGLEAVRHVGRLVATTAAGQERHRQQHADPARAHRHTTDGRKPRPET